MITSVPLRPAKYAQGKHFSFRNKVDSLAPLESVPFGYGTVRGVAQDTGRLPLQNMVILTLGSDTGASNRLRGKFQVTKIDGTALDPADYSVDRTYADSHSDTMDNLKNDIEAFDSDLSVSLSTNKRVITVTIKGNKKLEVNTTFAITGGSAVTVTTTYDSADKIRGAAEKRDGAPQILGFAGVTDEPKYTTSARQMMSVLTVADPAVPVTGSPKVGDPVYCLYKDYTDTDTVVNKRGTFRTDTDSGAAPVILVDGAEFSGEADNGLAPVTFSNF